MLELRQLDGLLLKGVRGQGQGIDAGWRPLGLALEFHGIIYARRPNSAPFGAEPRAYWGAYGASKAAFDNLLASYAQEVERISETRVAILDPGATRTQMRARAYPGEDPQTVKPPEAVAGRIVALLTADFPTFYGERIDN